MNNDFFQTISNILSIEIIFFNGEKQNVYTYKTCNQKKSSAWDKRSLYKYFFRLCRPDSKCGKRGSKYFNKPKNYIFNEQGGRQKRYYRKAKQNCSSSNLREYNKNISYYRQEKKASLPKREIEFQESSFKNKALLSLPSDFRLDQWERLLTFRLENV